MAEGAPFLEHVLPGAVAPGLLFAALLLFHRRSAAATWACVRPLRLAFLRPSPRLYEALLFAVGLTAYLSCSWFIFDGIPHIQDSISQVWQAKIFAIGRAWVPAPAHPEFFHVNHIVLKAGRWYGQYPPTHAVLMLPGMLLGIPWILNPLMGAGTLVLLVRIGREAYDELTGRIAGLLGLLSPFIFFMSGEFMNHSTALFLFALFAYLFFRSWKRPSGTGGLLVGAALGALVLARPLTATGLCFAFGVAALYRLVRRVPGSLRWTLGVATSLIGFAALLALYNNATTGSPLVTGMQANWGDAVIPGFGAAPWGPPHTFKSGVIHNLNNFNLFNRYLFEWPFPSLLFVIVLVLLLRRTGADVLLLWSLLGLSAAYLTYYYQDYCFGPRFLYEGSAPAILLSASAMTRLSSEGFRKLRISPRRLASATFVVMAIATVFMLVARMPVLVREYTPTGGYWGANGRLQRFILNQVGEKDALVFISSHYDGTFILNDPLLSGKIIVAKDLGDRNATLIADFPEREVWLERGGRLTRQK